MTTGRQSGEVAAPYRSRVVLEGRQGEVLRSDISMHVPARLVLQTDEALVACRLDVVRLDEELSHCGRRHYVAGGSDAVEVVLINQCGAVMRKLELSDEMEVPTHLLEGDVELPSFGIGRRCCHRFDETGHHYQVAAAIQAEDGSSLGP